MHIRQAHPIRDRIKLILILILLLVALLNLAKLVEKDNIPNDVTQNDQTQSDEMQSDQSQNDQIQNDESQTTTILMETLLKKALEPIGSTMYIWGGGWNEEDTGAGPSATQLGISPQWKAFADLQDETYDYKLHRFELENGLDCSGFVGWAVYNTFETENGQPGYVTKSTEMAKSLADRGWGMLLVNPKEFLPGDIVSMKGHVWICLGKCEDGSVLLVHSSPPGVSVCGTALQQTNVENAQESQAVKLATQYMSKYHPDWQSKYPKREVKTSFLEQVSVFRWSDSVMFDAKEIQNKSAEEIMRILSPDM